MKKCFVMAAACLAVALVVVLLGCWFQVQGHDHSFAKALTYDETHHWKEALCDDTEEVKDKAEHEFPEGETVCSVCGYDKSCSHTYGEWKAGRKHCTKCRAVQVCNHPKEMLAAGNPATNEQAVYRCTDCYRILRVAEGEVFLTPVYKFTEEVRVLPSTYSGTNGTSSTYVEFGDFPQSEAQEGTTFSTAPGANGYYVGSDGNYYAKVNLKYFKVEPIKWRVLTDSYDYDGSEGSATARLLLAENILTANVPYYYSKSGTRTVTTEKGTVSGIEPNNYEYSQIRAYLNGLPYYNDSNEAVETYRDAGFLQTAFTAAARDLIKTTYVDNSAASTTDSTGALPEATDYKCNDTQDKIFLLSENEVTTAGYGFEKYNVYKGDGKGTTDSSRIPMTTAYARANNAYQNTTAGYGGYWWLRSPHNGYSHRARVVSHNGYSVNNNYVTYTFCGVVPALAIEF